MNIGIQNRFLIAHPDGRVAYKEQGTIYLAKIGAEYLTSKLMIYKDFKAAQKVIDKDTCVLKGCTVKPVEITYEVIE
ncbi:MAG: hypothetical protein MJ097_00535 [Dorea sp.]|nr:hypothetical protein [Dorea sp.]